MLHSFPRKCLSLAKTTGVDELADIHTHRHTHTDTNLIDSQINASVWNDAQSIGHVAPVEGAHALLLKDLLGTVHHARVLACLPQSQASLQHLSPGRMSSQGSRTG